MSAADFRKLSWSWYRRAALATTLASAACGGSVEPSEDGGACRVVERVSDCPVPVVFSHEAPGWCCPSEVE